MPPRLTASLLLVLWLSGDHPNAVEGLLSNNNSIRLQLPLTRTRQSSSARRMVSNTVTEKQKAETTTKSSVTISADENTVDQESSSSSLWSKIQEKIGKVDESRLIFPEYESGQVPQLYTTLQYTQESGRVVQATSVTTSTTSTIMKTATGAALVATTALGPGFVAIPAATQPIGFVTSAVAYVPAFLYMTFSGLLLSELFINQMVTKTGRPSTVVLPDLLLLPSVKWLAHTVWWVVQYVLLLFCLVQGSQVISPTLATATTQLDMDATATAILAAAAVGLGAATETGVFLGVSLLALAATAVLSGPADWTLLVTDQHPAQVLNCAPILFTSLVYQTVIPRVVTMLEGNRRQIQTAVVVGTSLTFVSMLLWNALVTAQAVDMTTATTATTVLLGTALTGSAVQWTQSLAASWKAVFSSLSSSSTDRDSDSTSNNTNNSNDNALANAVALALAIVPPAVLATTDLNMDEITRTSLEYVGLFGTSTLFLVLTPISAWKERYSIDTPLVTKPMVPLGKIPLGSMWKAAATLIVEQGAEKLGVFEFLQEHLMNP